MKKLVQGIMIDEPDELEFVDEVTGYNCKIIRCRPDQSGHLCGYVEVPKIHPWFGKSYSDNVTPKEVSLTREVSVDDIGVINAFFTDFNPNAMPIGMLVRAHGGVTWANSFTDNPDKWYIGFDCAHSGDFIPMYDWSHGVYRDLEFVIGQCQQLASDIKEYEYV